MKMTIVLIGLLIRQSIMAQGTVYLSNLGQISAGNNPIGSNSWFAAEFITGSNPGGYSLDSVQLGMANASGNPGGFNVAVYTDNGISGARPGGNIGTLTGSLDPLTAGNYTYTPASSLVLSPSTDYFIVLTAGTALADGAYEWNALNSASYNLGGGWYGSIALASNNGSSWGYSSTYPQLLFPQYAITATAIPESSPAFLLLLGSGILFYVRQRRST